MGKLYFRLPPLPKPEYQALQKLCALLGCTQLEVFCVGIRVLARAAQAADPSALYGTLDGLQAVLVDFRATAPSETAPLL